MALQGKVRTEVFQLEDTLAQVKKEYEMLRIEFEQTLAANEQAGKPMQPVRFTGCIKVPTCSCHVHVLLVSQVPSIVRCVT